MQGKDIQSGKRFAAGMIKVSACMLIMLKIAHAGEAIDVNKEMPDKPYVSNFSIDGYIKNETAMGLQTSSRLTKVQNLVQLEIEGEVADSLDMYALIWAMYDAAYDLGQKDYPGKVRDEYGSTLTANDAFDQTLRELYFDVLLRSVDIRIGKQQVVWGEAIGLRITDIVNPQDYREFILDDFIDSRIPMWMVKLNWYVGPWTVEGLWIPCFEPDRPALAGSEWEWTFNGIDLPAGLNLNIHNPKEPSKNFENQEFGTRISGLLGGWNVALSYLYAWDDSPARHLRLDSSNNTLHVEQLFHRMHMFGFTFANAFGRFVPRGEFSYNIGKYFSAADQLEDEGLAKKDFLYYMVGTDYSILDYYFNLQLIQKIIMDYRDSIYEDEVQTNFSLRFQAKLFNETFKPEILIIYGSNDGSWMVRPKVVYDFTDQLTGAIGLDIFSGPSGSFLGQFDSKDSVYLEFKYGF